jgi:AcrR family transcriptional regulator
MSETRAKLLTAAADTLRDAGIAGLSARAIATRAGVNQALIFYHFSTVAELVVAATRQAVDESVGYYRAEFTRVASLGELLEVGRHLHDRELSRGNVAMMSQLMAGAQQDPALAAAARYAMAAWSNEVESVVRRLIAGSPLQPVAEPRGLARAICAAFIGFQLYDGVDSAAAEDALDAIELLGVLVDLVDELGPVARRGLQGKLRRATARPAKSDTTV